MDKCQQFIDKVSELRFLKIRERQINKFNRLLLKKEGNITWFTTRANPQAGSAGAVLPQAGSSQAESADSHAASNSTQAGSSQAENTDSQAISTSPQITSTNSQGDSTVFPQADSSQVASTNSSPQAGSS